MDLGPDQQEPCGRSAIELQEDQQWFHGSERAEQRHRGHQQRAQQNPPASPHREFPFR
jgi:hypothetical protein